MTRIARFCALVVLVFGLATASAFAKPSPMMVDDGGGGSSTPQVYIIRYVYTDPNGNEFYWNCEYIDFGNGLVIQNRCW